MITLVNYGLGNIQAFANIYNRLNIPVTVADTVDELAKRMSLKAAELIKELRVRLDLAGFNKVGIFVSGGVNLERIAYLVDNGAPVDAFGVGSYISGAKPIDFTADLHEVEGKPIAKRGRIPGITPNPRLKRVM